MQCSTKAQKNCAQLSLLLGHQSSCSAEPEPDTVLFWRRLPSAHLTWCVLSLIDWCRKATKSACSRKWAFVWVNLIPSFKPRKDLYSLLGGILLGLFVKLHLENNGFQQHRSQWKVTETQHHLYPYAELWKFVLLCDWHHHHALGIFFWDSLPICQYQSFSPRWWIHHVLRVWFVMHSSSRDDSDLSHHQVTGLGWGWLHVYIWYHQSPLSFNKSCLWNANK